jgi:hypothetical protein
MIFSGVLDKESTMPLEPYDTAEASKEICSRTVTHDHCYAATQVESLPFRNTPDAASMASSDHIKTLEQSCPGCQSSAVDIQQLHVEMQTLKESLLALQTKKSSLLSKCTLFICNDKQVKLNTGLPNKAALNSLFNLLKARAFR